jgi:ribosomal protein L37AE/L43A
MFAKSPTMLDLFNIVLIVIVLAIIGFIVYAVRRTMAQIGKSGVSGEKARDLAKQIRERDVRCPRCNRQSFALLGTGNQWKCESCNHEFEGPDHMPMS